MKVRTLDGSKDVRGARHEPKGRPGLNVLATSCPWLCDTDRTHELDLSCTKGDLRLFWRRYVWVCVKNNSPAGWNRFESLSLSDSENLTE